MHTCVSHIPHRMLESPNNGIQNELELCRWDVQQSWSKKKITFQGLNKIIILILLNKKSPKL